MILLAPQSVQSLHTALEANTDATILAGGTDLLVKIRREQIYPDTIISLGSLGWNRIQRNQSTVEIGSMVTAAQLSTYDCSDVDVLSRAASQVGGMQIRNMATVGGNVVNASPAADMALALLALDADVTIMGRETERRVSLRDFFTGPGQTVLSTGEIVRSFQIPIRSNTTIQWFRKVGPRSRHFISRVALAAVGTLENGTFSRIRIALGSVAPIPRRALQTERYLKTVKLLGENEIETAAKIASSEDCSPISDHRSSEEYRRRVVFNIIREFLNECTV